MAVAVQDMRLLTEAVARLKHKVEELEKRLSIQESIPTPKYLGGGGVSATQAVDAVEAEAGLSLSGFLDLPEITPPSLPSADTLRLFVEDFKGFPFFSFADTTGMTRKLVRDSVFVGKNVTGTAIPAARAVYASGSTEGVPTIAKARANSDTTMPAIGVTLEAIADDGFGRIMQVGLVENVDTSAFSAGDILYVSAVTAGILVATPPAAPNYRQEVGTILVSDAAVGSVQVVARSMMNFEEQGLSLLIDGTRAMTGNLDVGANRLQFTTTAFQEVPTDTTYIQLIHRTTNAFKNLILNDLKTNGIIYSPWIKPLTTLLKIRHDSGEEIWLESHTGAAFATVAKLKGGEFQTDTINEMTAATGVTADGVLLKDGDVSLTSQKKVKWSATEYIDNYDTVAGTWAGMQFKCATRMTFGAGIENIFASDLKILSGNNSIIWQANANSEFYIVNSQAVQVYNGGAYDKVMEFVRAATAYVDLNKAGDINMLAQKYLTLGVFTDANRGAAGTAGRFIFNSDDGAPNVDDGTDWRDMDGNIT